MAEAALKMPEKTEAKPPAAREWRPLQALRREIDQLFEDFDLRSFRSGIDFGPFWRGEVSWGKVPAADFVESDKAYVVTAELPGMSESDVDVKYAEGTLTMDELERCYYTLVHARTGNYQETARRLGRDWRTVKAKIDGELLQRLSQGGYR